jgi:hypothetical protein
MSFLSGRTDTWTSAEVEKDPLGQMIKLSCLGKVRRNIGEDLHKALGILVVIRLYMFYIERIFESDGHKKRKELS